MMHPGWMGGGGLLMKKCVLSAHDVCLQCKWSGQRLYGRAIARVWITPSVAHTYQALLHELCGCYIGVVFWS
jgi:hypothetical protein